MSGLVRDLFRLAFGGAVPARLEELVPWDLAERERLAFKACPILVLGGAGGPRGYVADVGEPDAFVARVGRVLGADAAAFLASAPAGVRRMVDADATSATLYLDDLQADAPSRDRGEDLMCVSWRWPDGASTRLVRYGAPPRHLLAPAWQRRIDDLHHAGLGGIWCVRWAGAEVRSLLWVNDTPWRGAPERTAAAVDALGDETWTACRDRARREGLLLVPDSVELRDDDAWEITLGVAAPR